MKIRIIAIILFACTSIYAQNIRTEIQADYSQDLNDSIYQVSLLVDSYSDSLRFVWIDQVDPASQVISSHYRFDLMSEHLCTPGTRVTFSTDSVLRLNLGSYNRFVLGNLLLLRMEDTHKGLINEQVIIIE